MKVLLLGLSLLIGRAVSASETPTVDNFTFEMAKDYVIQNGDRFPKEKAIVETLNKIQQYLPHTSAEVLSGGPVSSSKIAGHQSANIIQKMVKDYSVTAKNGISIREFHKILTSKLANMSEIDSLSIAAIVNQHLDLNIKN
jgi:hypothetical protein